jgi:hypothetical protein
VFYLTLVWRYNLALTSSQVQCQTSFNLFYRKPLDNNIYKQSELGGVIVIMVVINYGELVKVALNNRRVLKGVGG